MLLLPGFIVHFDWVKLRKINVNVTPYYPSRNNKMYKFIDFKCKTKFYFIVFNQEFNCNQRFHGLPPNCYQSSMDLQLLHLQH